EREAAAQHGVAARIGHSQPHGPRSERPQVLWRPLLELVVLLEEIVEAQHEQVIGRAPRTPRLQEAAHALAELAEPAAALPAGKARLLAVALQQLGERLRRDPDARLAGVDVDEDTQDTSAQ